MLATPANPAFLKKALTFPQIKMFWKDQFADRLQELGFGQKQLLEKTENEFSLLVKDKFGREQ